MNLTWTKKGLLVSFAPLRTPGVPSDPVLFTTHKGKFKAALSQERFREGDPNRQRGSVYSSRDCQYLQEPLLEIRYSMNTTAESTHYGCPIQLNL